MKIRLVENIAVKIDKSNIEVFDKPILFESDGRTISKRGTLKNVPVSRFVLNLNERCYPCSLWKRVEESGVFNGSMCMADHPTGETESVKDYCGVWSNFRVLEDVAVADLTVVGNIGQTMLEIVQAGGKLGFSTVGCGELAEDRCTVKDDYEYERTDYVTVPSQQVYATIENLGESVKQTSNSFIENTIVTPLPIKETTNQHSNILNTVTNNKVTNLENVITNNKEEEKSEVNGMGDINKIQELAFKNKINRTIKEAKKKENILEAIEDLNEIELLESMTDEKVLIKNTISELQGKLEDSKKNLEEKFVKTYDCWHNLFNVDWRTDFRKRHRKRYFAVDICGNSW